MGSWSRTIRRFRHQAPHLWRRTLARLRVPRYRSTRNHAQQPTLPWQPQCARLRQIADQITTGDAAGAELALSDWRNESTFPPEAAALLAALLAARGQMRHALDILDRQSLHDHPQIGKLLISAATLVGDADRVRRAVHELHHHEGYHGAVADWLALMAPPGASDLTESSPAAAQHLAAELTLCPDLVPTLVEAQRADPAERDIALLREALVLVSRDLESRRWKIVFYEALAKLAHLGGDIDDARRWAHRGLKLNPYHAPFALLLGEIDDDQRLGPPARKALQRVLHHHPDYPDVRAAMIRRYMRDGETAEARKLLAQWSETDPDHPILTRLRGELAA